MMASGASPSFQVSAARSMPMPERVRKKPLRERITVTGSSITVCTSETVMRSRLLDHGAALVAEALGVLAHLGGGELASLGGRAQQLLQRRASFLSVGQLLLDLDAFEPRQLAQPDLEDVLGLALARA